MVHFNWTQLIGIVGHHNIHVATAAATTLLLLVVALAARVSLGSGQVAVAPAEKFSIRGIFELILELIVSLNDMVLGAGHREFVPLFGSIFVFILANNLMGLVPGMTPATDNYNTTLAVGLFTFVMYNYYGVKEHGLAYFKHFLGPVMWLAWLMLPIELVSHLVRPLSLGLRLMGNMQGDHTVLGIFLDITPWGVPAIFYALGTFVCFVQAFVFTLLSMVYVSMAIAHDH